MIIYAGPSLLVRLLDPAQAATFVHSAEVQIVSTAQALAECTADAVAHGLAHGMTPEGALALLGDLVDAEDGLVEIVGLDADGVAASAAEISTQTGLGAGHAWHLAAAEQCVADLAESGEARRFGADDGRQAAVARARGWGII
ncbi:hypothetical protein E3T55_04040 [Cryobacterium frigoriphilum]|uniref:PIN domain-containing protein n=1 Tax=Cryobacterium frigoriphilum TaxID=1259150 RepID=A0A4V3IS15_9MICO|nr:hypothetical protein [Cryobacterium frigoriphilum]TFD54594.1 hypothetical protein E3T55_04040 [Cryobacterium frigoriphilum]